MNPTDCGCCGCCPFSTFKNVSLAPDGTNITGCCADVATDPNNCGACGNACPADAWCVQGACTPVFSPCATATQGYATCDDYCRKNGATCSAACGPSGMEALEWWGVGSNDCSDTAFSSNGTCSDSFAGFTGARCCCEF